MFGSLTHSDIFGCSIRSTTENWSGEKIDLFRDLCGLVYNCVYAGINMHECVCTCVVCACVYTTMCAMSTVRANVYFLQVRVHEFVYEYLCRNYCVFQISCIPELATIQCRLL